MQRGRDEIEPRRKRRKLHPTKVAVALELAEPGRRICGLAMVMAHPDPIIQPLQSEVKIIVGLQLDDSQAAVRCDTQQIEESAIARAGDRRNLRVNMRGIEMWEHP